MARPVTRTINLYAIHARTNEGVVNYEELFSWIAGLPAQDTSVSVTKDLVFSLDRVRLDGDKFEARVIASSPDEVPTFFDYRTGELAEGETPAGKWLAKVSRISVDTNPEGRLLAMESSRAGVSIILLERYFARLAKKEEWSSSLTMDLNPIPSPSLRREIEGLTRIREAAVIANRPNFDWQDTSNNLAELAAESGGHVAEAVVRAPRKESLSKRRGIVDIILKSLGSAVPNLKDFRVIGRPEGSGKDVTLSSARNQRRTFVDVDPSESIAEHDRSVFSAASDLMDTARAEREAEVELTEPGVE